MGEQPQVEDRTQIVRDFAGQVVQSTSKVYSNIDQEIIMITEDKVRLCLIEHLSRMEKRRAWLTPLGILLTVIAVLPTTTFQDFLSINAATWKAMFIIAGIISAIWLVKSLWEARFVSTSIYDVVADIKRTSITRETTR